MFFRTQSRKQLLVWMAAALILLGFSQAWCLLRNAGTGDAAEVIAAAPENQDALITGTVIRQEQVIEGDANISWSCRKDSGTRAAPGEILFQENSPDLQQWAQNEIAEAQTAQYRNESLVRRRERLWELIRTSAEQENGTELKALMLAESEQPETESAAHPGTNLQTISAPEDGIFAQGVDGLETLLTPEHPTIPYALLPLDDPPKAALGRLITSDTWYFSALWEDAPEEGETVRAALLGGDFGTCKFTVEQVGRQGEGYRVLLSCNRRVEAVAMVRRLTVKILSD